MGENSGGSSTMILVLCGGGVCCCMALAASIGVWYYKDNCLGGLMCTKPPEATTLLPGDTTPTPTTTSTTSTTGIKSVPRKKTMWIYYKGENSCEKKLTVKNYLTKEQVLWDCSTDANNVKATAWVFEPVGTSKNKVYIRYWYDTKDKTATKNYLSTNGIGDNIDGKTALNKKSESFIWETKGKPDGTFTLKNVGAKKFLTVDCVAGVLKYVDAAPTTTGVGWVFETSTPKCPS
jgi:hypothetical protein